MIKKLRVKRGLKKNLPALDVGELALTTDESKLYIGHADGNQGLVTDKELTLVNTEISKVTTQLAQTVTDPVKKIAVGDFTGTGRKNKTKVSFISDDGNISDYEVLKPIFESENVPCAVAIISKRVGTPNYMNREQILELQNELDWEVMSHTVDHLNLSSLNESQLEVQLYNSKRDLENMGFKPESIVYPYGGYNNTVKRISRKYYRSGYTFSQPNINTQPYNSYAIARVSLGVFFDPTSSEFPITNTFEDYYKPMVDKAVANNAWLIITLHPAQKFTDTGLPTGTFPIEQQEYLRQTIQYIKSLGIAIQNPRDVLNETGNILDLEGYSKDDTVEKYFRVGGNGEIKNSDTQKPFIEKKPLNAHSCTDKPSAFTDGNITINVIGSTNLTGTPNNNAGVLTTDKSSSVAGMYTQTFKEKILDNTKTSNIYFRSATTVDTWSPWQLINTQNLPQVSGVNAFSCNSLANDFPNGIVTRTTITSVNLAGTPSNLAGVLVTDRTASGFMTLNFQMYYEKSPNEIETGFVYYRNAKTGGTWTTWRKMGV